MRRYGGRSVGIWRQSASRKSDRMIFHRWITDTVRTVRLTTRAFCTNALKKWCPGPELNQRHRDFHTQPSPAGLFLIACRINDRDGSLCIGLVMLRGAFVLKEGARYVPAGPDAEAAIEVEIENPDGMVYLRIPASTFAKAFGTVGDSREQ